MASIKKNFFLTLVSQLLSVMTPLLVMPYLARRLQVNNIGISSFVESITYFFVIFATFGCSIYGQRQIAYCKGDERVVLKRFLEIFASVSITSCVSIVFFVGFILFQERYQYLYFIQTLEIIATWWDISWYYQGREEFKKLLFRMLFVKGSYILLIFLLIRDINDLPHYIFLRCFTLLLGSLVMLYPTLRNVIRHRIRFSWLAIPIHLKGMFLLFLPAIAIMVYTVLDKTMIGLITESPEQNGCYEEATRVGRVLMHVVSTISIVLLPRLASLYAKKDVNEIANKLSQSFQLIYFLTFPMIVGIYFVSPIFIPWFLGPGFEGAVVLTQVLSFLLLLIGIGRLLGTTLISMGRENIYTRNVATGAAINFVLNIFLISRYQALGAALASLIAEFCVTSIMIYTNRQHLHLKKIFMSSYKYLLAVVSMGGVLFGVERFLVGVDFYKIIMLSGIGAFTYVILLLIQREQFIDDFFHRFMVKAIRKFQKD